MALFVIISSAINESQHTHNEQADNLDTVNFTQPPKLKVRVIFANDIVDDIFSRTILS